MKLYSALSSALSALQTCRGYIDNPNHAIARASPEHWRGMVARHAERIEGLTRAHLPRGSGFDLGCHLDMDESRPNRLIVRCDFHHMDDNGYYCGWSEHTAIVTPSLSFGFQLRITGRNMRGIKEYITDTFHYCIDLEVE